MILPLPARTCLLACAVLLLGLPPARALINLDGSRNQLFVFGSVSLGYDSNVFADASGRDDYTMTGSVGVELKRRAGIIAVNATATMTYIAFGEYSGENAFNPNFQLELVKSSGRTTGSFTVGAYRESRSDSAVNLRTNSWNFPLGLNLKYPLNEKFYLTSQTSFLRRRYLDNTALANYTDYSEAVDLFYIYTSKLDLLGGYRIRVSRTSAGSKAYDHWLNVGATGSLLAKLNGSIRLGYQIRDVSGSSNENYNHFNILASLMWPVTRKLMLTGLISRDFNTVATGESVDTIGAQLRAAYSLTRKIEFTSGVGYGQNRFLGTPPPERRDTYFTYDFGVRYSMNEHLQVGASYNYFRNWSSLPFSDFERHGFTLDVSSRY